MSLKYFHMIFVTVVTLFCLGFAAWCFLSPDAPQTTAYHVAGAAGIVGAVLALVYGVWVWKKLKKVTIS